MLNYGHIFYTTIYFYKWNNYIMLMLHRLIAYVNIQAQHDNLLIQLSIDNLLACMRKSMYAHSCMCAHTCVCMHAHVHVCAHVCAHMCGAHTHTRACVWCTHTCVCAHMCMCIHVCMCACMHVHMWVHVYTRVCLWCL